MFITCLSGKTSYFKICNSLSKRFFDIQFQISDVTKFITFLIEILVLTSKTVISSFRYLIKKFISKLIFYVMKGIRGVLLCLPEFWDGEIEFKMKREEKMEVFCPSHTKTSMCTVICLRIIKSNISQWSSD